MSKPSDILTFLADKLNVSTTRYPTGPRIDLTFRGANKSQRQMETFPNKSDIQVKILGIEDSKIGEIDKDMYTCIMTLAIDLYTKINDKKGGEDIQTSQIIAWDNSAEAITNLLSNVDVSELKDGDENSYVDSLELLNRDVLDGSFGLDENLIPIRHTYLIEFETLEEF